MKAILVKAAITAAVSAALSLGLVLAVVPLLGGRVEGNAVLMAVLCPLLIAFPASAYTMHRTQRLRQAHRELLRAHAELAAANRRLAERASHDQMTGVLNREAFFNELARTQNTPDRGVLLIIDADHFKKINDSFGHLVGDEALLRIVAAIRTAVRRGDIVGRIGGEEFGAYLAGAGEAEAREVAERIRRQVEQIRFRPSGDRLLPLTVSIGGTVIEDEAPVSSLMRSADRRLYAAKHGGRNLTVMEDIPEAA